MTLQVIGAGFGRTGTLSLKTALERLGFGPCHHGIELMRHLQRVPLWEAAADGVPDWEQVFAGYRATVDWPGVAFWRELVDAYPDAKVVLTVRDAHQWYASVRNTFLAILDDDSAPRFLAETGIPAEDMERFSRLMGRLMGGGGFGDHMRDEHAAIAWFQRHIEEVRDSVPARRLLVYEVTQGWQPLCAFLEVEVPQGEPFPRLNDSQSFKTLIPRLVTRNAPPT